jgi:hypothetical protein
VNEFDEIIVAAGLSVPDDGSHLIRRDLGGSQISICTWRANGPTWESDEIRLEART